MESSVINCMHILFLDLLVPRVEGRHVLGLPEFVPFGTSHIDEHERNIKAFLPSRWHLFKLNLIYCSKKKTPSFKNKRFLNSKKRVVAIIGNDFFFSKSKADAPFAKNYLYFV